MKRLAIIIMLIAIPAYGFCEEKAPITVTGEISGGMKRLVSESADFVTTPFQISNNNLFMTLGVFAATGVTFAFDQDIQHKFSTGHTGGLDDATKIGSLVGDPYIHLGFAALVYGTAIVADSPKWKAAGEMMGEALILADVSTLLLKEVAGRARPLASNHKDDFRPLQFKNNYDSLPSMHTASSFAMASVAARTSESVPTAIAAYSAATLVGLSRMYQNKHWGSDILLGAAIGELSGRVVTSFHAGQGKGKDQRVAFVPTVTGTGATMNMHYHF